MKLVSWLLVIGGLDWGIIGLTGNNVLESIVGMGIARIVYLVVGVAAAYKLLMLLGRVSKK